MVLGGPKTSSKAPSYASSKLSPTDRPSHLLTGVKCRATSVAKNVGEPKLWFGHVLLFKNTKLRDFRHCCKNSKLKHLLSYVLPVKKWVRLTFSSTLLVTQNCWIVESSDTGRMIGAGTQRRHGATNNFVIIVMERRIIIFLGLARKIFGRITSLCSRQWSQVGMNLLWNSSLTILKFAT